MAVLEATTSVADISTNGERQVRLETTSHVWNVSNGTPEEILISANGSGLDVDDRIIMEFDFYFEDTADIAACNTFGTQLSGTATYDAATLGCVVTDAFYQISTDNNSVSTPQDISPAAVAESKCYRIDARARTQDSPVITDTTTVSRIVEGSGAYGGSFSNGAHSVPSDQNGVLNFTGSSTTFTGYYGAEKLAYTTNAEPSEGFFNVTNLVYSSGISGPAAVFDTEGALFGDITAWAAGTSTAGSRTFDVKARGVGSPEATTFVGLQQTLTKVHDGFDGISKSRQVRLETSAHVWNPAAGTPSEVTITAYGEGLDVDDRIIMEFDVYYEEITSADCTSHATTLGGTGTYDAATSGCIVTDCFEQTSTDSISVGLPSNINLSAVALGTAHIYRIDARAKSQDSPVITDTLSMSRIMEGGAYHISFSNGAHSVPNDKDDILDFTNSSTLVSCYHGVEKLTYTTASEPGLGEFSISNIVRSTGISGPNPVTHTQGILFGDITAWTAGTGTAGSITFDVRVRGTSTVESTDIVSQQQTLTKVSDGAEGAEGVTKGVIVVYASDASGTGASFTQGSLDFVQYFEYEGTTPTNPAVGGTWVKFVGNPGDSIHAIYATDIFGSLQSFTIVGGGYSRGFVTFYEAAAAPTLPVSGQTFIQVEGTNGDPGATWTSGVTTPGSTFGNSGDFFLNTATEDVYEKITSLWVQVVPPLRGTNGADPDVQNWIFKDSASNPGKPTCPSCTVGTTTLAEAITDGWVDASPASTTNLLWTTVGTQTEGVGDFVWGEPVQLTGDTGPQGNSVTGGTGPRGAGVYSGSTSLTSDPGGNQAVGSGSTFGTDAQTVLTGEGAGSPRNGDRMTLTNGDFVMSRYYSGGLWREITQLIDGNLIVTGSILAETLENNDSNTNGFRLGQTTSQSLPTGAGVNAGTYDLHSTVKVTSNTENVSSSPEIDQALLVVTKGVTGTDGPNGNYGIMALCEDDGDHAAALISFKHNGSSYHNGVVLSGPDEAVYCDGSMRIGDTNTSYTLMLNGVSITSGGGGGGGTNDWDGSALVGGGAAATARTSIDAAQAIHGHAFADVVGVAAATHSHAFADVTGVAASGHLHTGVYAPLSHNQAFSTLTGTATTAQLTTGASGSFTITSGTVSAGDFNATSDRNAKHSIAELEADRAMEALESIKPVSFVKKETEKASVGFIAQDVEEFYPDLVGESEGLKSLNYSQMTAILWKQNQELLKRIEKLEGER
jgi:hypothetical protein